VNGPSFLEILGKRLAQPNDRRGVDGSSEPAPLARVRVSTPVFSPSRGDRSAGRRTGSKGCACDGKRSLSTVRK
jgi:hypothetical protein